MLVTLQSLDVPGWEGGVPEWGILIGDKGMRDGGGSLWGGARPGGGCSDGDVKT